jgi:hypothetical protein
LEAGTTMIMETDITTIMRVAKSKMTTNINIMEATTTTDILMTNLNPTSILTQPSFMLSEI